MEKTAWQVGKIRDAHCYLWVYKSHRLTLTDKHKWHSFYDKESDDPLHDAWRGLVIVFPKQKVGHVFCYHEDTHSDAEFIPNDVWQAMKHKFSGYTLFEEHGLYLSGRMNFVGDFIDTHRTPPKAKAMHASIRFYSNALLQYPVVKHAGFYSHEDLDHYDSELAHNLLELHDEILNNPVRDYDSSNPMSVRRYYNYTMKSLKDRLYVAIRRALPALDKTTETHIVLHLKSAKASFNRAEVSHLEDDLVKVVKYLEEGFSTLHAAVDIIRDSTRNVPKVNHLWLKPEACSRQQTKLSARD